MIKKILKNRKNKYQYSDQLLKRDKSFLMLDDQDEEMIIDNGLGDGKSAKILLSFARPFKWQITGALLIMFLSSLLAIFSSKLIGDLVEYGLIKKQLNVSIYYAAGIISLEALSIFFVWLGSKKLAEAASRVIFTIRQRLFSKLQDLPMQYYDRQPQGRIVTRVTHDVEGIEQFFTSGLGNLIQASMMTCIAMVAMVVSNFHLGLIMVAAVVPTVILVYKTKDLLRVSNRQVSKYSSNINAKLSEYINGVETIRLYGLEKWSMKNYEMTVKDYLIAQLKGNFLFAWSTPLVSFFISIPLFGLVWYGGFGVLEGTYTVGLFVAFVRYYERFSGPMMLLAREIHVVQQAFSSTERVMNFLNEDDEDQILTQSAFDEVKFIHGDIRFEHVSMKYIQSDWILKDLSFHIKSGEKIGFVGKTGCGKSSTVSLLSRLYEYQAGDVYLDNKSIREFDRHNLRSKIGFVSQDAIIFKATLRDNLTSDSSLSDMHIFNACQETGLFKALSKEGFNLNMEILEGGANLSVGQKQLLSLTRVLLKDPSILILDEATANIDPHYEQIIQNAVMKIMDGRTCIMIAHRLVTLNQCDRIFVFDDGKLVEQGSLDELLSNKNYFYNLHHAQSTTELV